MKFTTVLFIRDPELRNELAREFRARGCEVVARFQSEGWGALVRSPETGAVIIGEDIADADPAHIQRKAAQLRPELPVLKLRRDPDGLKLSVFNGEEVRAEDESAVVALVAPRFVSRKREDRSAVSFETYVKLGDEGEEAIRIAGNNPKIARIIRMIDTVAPTGSTVLIQGESGTGKDLFAQLLHQRSRRSEGPWISVNCGAIPSNLIESELFGYERGAFTGADTRKDGLFLAAHGGTLFLDEIGEMPVDTQTRLLRVLQSGTFRPVGSTQNQRVDVRIIAATNRDLKEEVRAGRFRLDLYYRLNVIGLALPPLRERPEDLPDLLESIMDRLAKKGIEPAVFNEATMEQLSRHQWSGNIRELENITERLLLLYPDGKIEPDELQRHLNEAGIEELVEATTSALSTSPGPAMDASPYSLEMTLKELEEIHIRRVLTKYRGNKTRAARALGINVKTLYNKMKSAGMNRDEFVQSELTPA